LGVLAANFVVLGSLAEVSRVSAKDLRLQRRLEAKKAKIFKKRVAALAVVVLLVVVSVSVYSFRGGGGPKMSNGIVLLVTSEGNITIELYGDMPITTANFKNLTSMGIYDGTIFHRVINDTSPYMIQGGDPTGTGYGDPSIARIPDEFSSNSSHNRNDRGTIAMANAGSNTGSSQFFINIQDNNYLDGKHPVFGVVLAGMDVVDAIASVPRDANNRPLTNVTVFTAQLIS
jgi:peptidylprolyl isomerase